MSVLVRLGDYARLMRLHRPIGIFLLMWPALWAVWLAGAGKPNPVILAIFVAGVVLMRSAGCVINDYADREFDPHVARTRDRPLAAGRVSTAEAMTLFVILCLISLVLVLQLNRLTIYLSFVGLFLAVSYPFMKRYTHLPQFYLGMAFGWAIPMAFAAELGTVPVTGWLMFAANIAWSVAYDTAYAMVDRADDVKIGVKSTAILFGTHDRTMVGVFHIIFLVLMLGVGVLADCRLPYYIGLAAAAGLAMYEQGLIAAREPQACFRAFLHNNWIGAAVFAGLVVSYLVKP